MRFCFHHRGVWGPAYTSPGRGSPKPKLIFVFFNARLREERRWWALVICAPSASRGHADERAVPLLLNALNGPAT